MPLSPAPWVELPLAATLSNVSQTKAPRPAVSLLGVRGAAKAFLLANLGRKSTTPWVIVTANDEVSRELAGDLEMAGLPAERLVTWDPSPYSAASPSIVTRNSRARTLFQLSEWIAAPQSGLLIASVPALNQASLPLRLFQSRTLRIRKGDPGPFASRED